MKNEFKYKRDKRTKRFTGVILLLVILTVIFFEVYSRSGYFPIWFLFFVATVLLLCILSIPRKIKVTADAVEIHCIVELTSIALEDIVSIRKMDKKEMKYSFPLLACYGFFGYYGWFYNFSEMSLFKVYASRWNHFVRINDIYETTYVVNCEEADELIAAVMRAKEERSERNFRDDTSKDAELS